MEEGSKEKEIDAKKCMMGVILKIMGLAMLFGWLIWLAVYSMICC